MEPRRIETDGSTRRAPGGWRGVPVKAGMRRPSELEPEATEDRRRRILRHTAEAPSVGRQLHSTAFGQDASAEGWRSAASETLGSRGAVHEAALRCLHFTVAAVSLVLTAPLFLLIAVAIKLDSGSPVLYRQVRVGMDRRRRGDGDGSAGSEGRRTGNLGGRPFVLYKFRTMEVNAERATGPSWAGPEDERVTRLGRFLRRHRLDELPQLWNVVKGDMAVVGPRPERPLFFQRLREVFKAYPKRQTVPPGITGWAQVNRGSDTSLDDVEHKLRFDLEYLKRRSVWFDAYIMLKTPVVMFRREVLDGGGESGHTSSSFLQEET